MAGNEGFEILDETLAARRAAIGSSPRCSASKHIALTVGKFDLVGFDRDVFERIATEYREFASELAFATIQLIPMSARFGDNVTRQSSEMPWYLGPTLLDHLENVSIDDAAIDRRSGFPFN